MPSAATSARIVAAALLTVEALSLSMTATLRPLFADGNGGLTIIGSPKPGT